MMENSSFQKMAKKYSSVLIIFLCAIFITCVFGHRGVSMASQNEKQQKINSDNLTVRFLCSCVGYNKSNQAGISI